MKPIIFTLFMILNSCAWNKEALRESKKSENLVDEFDLGEKFKAFEEDNAKKEKIPEKEIVKAKSEIVPKKKRVEKKVSKKKKNTPKEKTKISVQEPVLGSEGDDEEIREDLFEKLDQSSKRVWQNLRPRLFKDEQMVLDVKFFGVTAGKVFIETLPVNRIGGKDVFHFKARIKSAPFYSYFYSLDDYVETFIDKESLQPIKYSLVQDESKQQVKDLQLFDLEKRKTYFWYKKVKEGKTKEENKEAVIPQYFADSFYPLFLIRWLPLKVGEKWEFPIITRAKLWVLKLEVLAKEKITIGKKEVDAIKIKAVTRFPGVLKKRGDILFWFSNDKKRSLLKFTASVKIGSLDGVLVDEREGTEISFQ